MTGSNHSMTCDACKDALTDYVCDELDAAAAASVREHVAACADCAAQLARFARVMTASAHAPLATPSARVREQVMLQAREALTRRSAQKHAPATSSSPLRSWFERLGQWAMSPQVAMATVLLLMVGIGFYALPFGAREPRAALTPTIEARPADEAASAAAAPIAASDRAEEAEGLAADAPETKQPSNDSPARRARAGSSGFAPKPSAKEKRADLESSGRAALDDALGGAGAPSARAKKAAAPSKTEAQQAPEVQAEDREFAPPPAPVAPKGATAASGYGGGASAPSERARSEPAMNTSADLAKAPAAGLDEGVRRMQSGDTAGAIRILQPLVSVGTETERQRARLWLARSYRANGDCVSALRHYVTLTARKDASSVVLSEAADCYAKTGDDAQAASLRARARSEAKPSEAASESAQ